MSDESGEKTEEPSQKKLDDARKKGQISKSKDLTGAFVFAAGFFAIAAAYPFVFDSFHGAIQDALEKVRAGKHLTFEEITQSAYNGLFLIVLLTLPAVGAGAIMGGLVDFLQVGSLFTMEPLIPKLDKLNPISGLKNLVSKKQIVELLKNTVKLVLSGYVAYTVIRGEIGLIVQTELGTPELIMSAASSIMMKLSIRIAILFLVFSIFDIWWQKRVFKKDMMMTKDEIKREYKESEGDPHHKAKRKEMHQEILEQTMMEDVATADVVVTNPDHYAIALKYDHHHDHAPRIVAKGVDARAHQIKQIARQCNVTEVRNIPLAHALYRLDLYKEIPESLYDAVAEVLSHVHALHQELDLDSI